MNELDLVQGFLFGPSPKEGAKWGQHRRLEFIDYRLQWDGNLNRSALTTFFGISVPQASLDIAEYMRRVPDNMVYDHKTKTYKATDAYKPIYSTSSLQRYLDDLLRASVSPDTPYGSFLGWQPPVAIAPRPGRNLSLKTVLAINNAIKQNGKMSITYQSVSHPEPISRVISPHSLANDGYRWHVRAYCHLREDFRDFLLSRILNVHSCEEDIPRIQNDLAWHQVVELELAPHPLLNPNQKKVLEMDYGMVDGVFKLECRQALIYYVLKQLGLEKDQSSVNPQSQQIILRNMDQIKDYLPNNFAR